MFKEIVGMAIKITPDNLEHIAVVNKGVAPEFEGFYTGSYFVLGQTHSLPNRILPGFVFEVTYQAQNPNDYPLNTSFFVEIEKI